MGFEVCIGVPWGEETPEESALPQKEKQEQCTAASWCFEQLPWRRATHLAQPGILSSRPSYTATPAALQDLFWASDCRRKSCHLLSANCTPKELPLSAQGLDIRSLPSSRQTSQRVLLAQRGEVPCPQHRG